MKKLILYLSIFFVASVTHGQVKVEALAGGSNFYGMSLNTAFNIPLSEDNDHLIVPVIGLGMLLPFWDVPKCIIHSGLNYSYKKYGLGTEISGFINSPFWKKNEVVSNDFVNMIVYPNANYNFPIKEKWYLGISAGAYFAFSKQYNYEQNSHRIRFEGDVIPGAGLSFGYKL